MSAIINEKRKTRICCRRWWHWGRRHNWTGL